MSHAPNFDPVPRLWAAARVGFARLRQVVSDAARIARRAMLGAGEMKRMRDGLGSLEALVRQTVLIEALAMLRAWPRQNGPRIEYVRVGDARAVPARTPRQGERKPTLRMWPHAKPHPARIRDLGPPLILRDVWKDNADRARARHLSAVRVKAMPAWLRIDRRIEALARVLEKPRAVVCRLARKLRDMPRLIMKLAARPAPRSPYADPNATALARYTSLRDAAAYERLDSS